VRASEIVWHLGKATDEGWQHAVRIVRATAGSVLRGFQKGSLNGTPIVPSAGPTQPPLQAEGGQVEGEGSALRAGHRFAGLFLRQVGPGLAKRLN
jgi:hypothetical protein